MTQNIEAMQQLAENPSLFAQLILDFKPFNDAFLITNGFNLVTQPAALQSEFVLIDLAGIADSLEHFAGIQGTPIIPIRIPGCIGHNEMSVKLGIEGPRSIMPKCGSTKISANLRLSRESRSVGSKTLKFRKGFGGGIIVSRI